MCFNCGLSFGNFFKFICFYSFISSLLRFQFVLLCCAATQRISFSLLFRVHFPSLRCSAPRYVACPFDIGAQFSYIVRYTFTARQMARPSQGVKPQPFPSFFPTHVGFFRPGLKTRIARHYRASKHYLHNPKVVQLHEKIVSHLSHLWAITFIQHTITRTHTHTHAFTAHLHTSLERQGFSFQMYVRKFLYVFHPSADAMRAVSGRTFV